jgi:CspA family cold shock protein
MGKLKAAHVTSWTTENRAGRNAMSVITIQGSRMPKGTVKWFNPTKGYGFIQPSGGGGRDVFVHVSAVERAGLSTLNEGQHVEYEEVTNRGKTSAENLKVSQR